MLNWWVFSIILLLYAESECGFISVKRDHVVHEKMDPGVEGDSEMKSSNMEDTHGLDAQGRGTKDIAIPLLTGVMVKVLMLLPLILTTLALIAGFSLAASKAALLLGSGLALYYYINDNKQLFLPVTNKELSYHPPEFSSSQFLGSHLPEQFYPHELQEHNRDRMHRGLMLKPS